MKKYSTTGVIGLTLFTTVIASAGTTPPEANRFYLGFHTDMQQQFAQDNNQGGWETATSPLALNSGGFQAGVKWHALRMELSLNYTGEDNDDNNNNESFLAIDFKGAYDIHLGNAVSAYPVIGVGLGHHFKESAAASVYSNPEFHWLLGAGATVAVNNKTLLSAEYNWVTSTQDPITVNGVSFKNFGSNVISIRWNHTFSL